MSQVISYRRCIEIPNDSKEVVDAQLLKESAKWPQLSINCDRVFVKNEKTFLIYRLFGVV